MSEKLTKKEIKHRVSKIKELGMDCPLTEIGLKNNVSIDELNKLWWTDKNILKGAINDISLYL